MQEMFRPVGLDADGYLGSDLFDREGLPFDPVGPDGSTEVRRQLREARQVAEAGDLRTARALCAEVVFEHLVELSRDRDLRRLAIATLVHARGFQLLDRLLVAVDGRRIRVAIGEPRAGGASPPHLIERSEDRGGTTFTVSERLYCDPSREALIDRWSEDLATP